LPPEGSAQNRFNDIILNYTDMLKMFCVLKVA